MEDNEEKLINIKKEMENVRELFVKGFITKQVYQKKQEIYLIWLQNMEHDKKVEDIKDSIKKYNKLSIEEKRNLMESIEMLWLNASVSKKKDVVMSDNSNENILRIRQLLAAAWSEDLKE